MKTIHIFYFFFIILIFIGFACSEKNTTLPTAPDKEDFTTGLLKSADTGTTTQKPTITALYQKTRKLSIEDLPDVGDDEKKEVESPSGYVWEIANWIIDIGGSQPTAEFGAYSMSHDGLYHAMPIDFIYVSDDVSYRIPSDPKPKWYRLVFGENGWTNWYLAYVEWIASYPKVWEAKAISFHSFVDIISITVYLEHPPVTINDVRK
jgi:hypothetical protein